MILVAIETIAESIGRGANAFSRWRMRRFVAQINEGWKTEINPDAEIVPVDIQSIRSFKKSFYDEVTKELANLGFRPGGDFENIHANALDRGQRTVERRFFTLDGKTAVNCFHNRTPGLRRVLLKLLRVRVDYAIVMFCSQLEDGAIVCTHRTPLDQVFSRPADCYGICLPLTTSLARVLETHLEQVRTVTAERGIDAWMPIRNADDYLVFLRHFLTKVKRYRENRGSLSIEEFEKLGRFSDDVTREMQRHEVDRYRRAEGKKRRQLETA